MSSSSVSSLVDLDRAAARVDLEPRRGARTLIDAVRHAVVVGVARASLGVHRGALGRVLALVEPVEDAVAVGVARAAVDIDRGALRRVGALVQSVEDAVAVLILRAAVRIDRGALGRVLALVEPVEQAVAVRVARAAVRVDGGALRRSGAAIIAVGYAVAVGVARFGPDREADAGAVDLAVGLGIRRLVARQPGEITRLEPNAHDVVEPEVSADPELEVGLLDPLAAARESDLAAAVAEHQERPAGLPDHGMKVNAPDPCRKSTSFALVTA